MSKGHSHYGCWQVWIFQGLNVYHDGNFNAHTNLQTLSCKTQLQFAQFLCRNEPNTAPRPLAGFVRIKGSNSSVLHWVWFGSENRNFASKRKHVQKPRCCLPHLWMVAVAWHAWPNDTRAQIGRWSTFILVKQEPLLLWLSAANGMLSLCGKCLSQWLAISEDLDMVILKESQKHQGPGSSFSE